MGTWCMALSTVQAQPRILPYSDGTDYKWYSSPCFIWCTEKREISNKPKNRADAKGGSQHEPFVLLHQKEPIKPRFKSTSSLHSTVIPVICLSDFQSNHRLLVIAKEFFLLESQTSANPSVTPVAQWLKWSDQVWAFLHSSSSRTGAGMELWSEQGQCFGLFICVSTPLGMVDTLCWAGSPIAGLLTGWRGFSVSC